MYKALKSAQNEIHETLLKFVDQASIDTSRCPRGDPCQCASISQSKPMAEPMPNPEPNSYDTRFESIEQTLQMLHISQNNQYEMLVGSIQNLNINLANIVKILSKQADTVETATTIPNLAPQAQGSDLKDVCVAVPPSEAHVSDLETPHDLDDQSAIDLDDTPDIDESVADEEEISPKEEEEEDQGVEVEEWTYKGRLFFKDSDNTVYANNSGEIGDAIGQYDPVKNVVKKLASN
jgi:hypothetical protein